MGWTFMQKPYQGTRVYMDSLATFEDTEKTSRVLRSSIVNRTEYYAAVEVTPKDGKPVYVYCLVAMLKHVPKDRDGYTFGYKDMSDSMGPYLYNCPKAILDLLTLEGANEYALQWRDKCRERLKLRETNKHILSTDGALFRLAEPITFSDGVTRETFRVQRSLNGRRIYTICNFTGLRCTISHLRDRKLFPVADKGDPQ
jgi:hypothetical protein